ncbi:unnamed protein product, partial [Pocillopora meandrina]
AREKEQLTRKIIHLETELNAKEKEITFLREAFFAKDKEISDLKEKLSQLQQSWQRNQLDFAKRTAATEEKFHEARKTIDELKGGANLSVMRNTTKLEESQSGLQFFNGKAYFDPQPSWFDTLSNNGGCLEIQNFPVTARELEAMKNVKSNSKPSTEAAQACPELKCQPPLAPEIKKNAPPSQRGDEFNEINGSFGQRVNPFSRKAKRLDRQAQSPVNMFETAEVDKCTLPIQHQDLVSNITIHSSDARIKPFSNKAEALYPPTLNCPAANIVGTEAENYTPSPELSGVPSNNITDSYGNKVNPFSKRAIGVTKQSDILTARLFPAQTVTNSATISSNDAGFKNTIFNITTQYSGEQIDSFSTKAEAQERPTLNCSAADIGGAENVNNTPPVHPNGVPSNIITDNKVNPFSKRATGVTRPPHTPTLNFAEVEMMIVPS